MTVINRLAEFTELENVNVISTGALPLCEVGKIKIGIKGRKTESREGKTFRLPEKLDHFIITHNYKDPATDTFVPDAGLMKQIAEQTGQSPDNLKYLPVRLLFDDPSLNLIVRLSCYKGGLWCIGDGKKALRLTDEKGNRQLVDCPCERISPVYRGKEKCKVFGRLMVLLEGVKKLGGVWVLRTTSWNSVRSLQGSMEFIRQITGGILAGIPLKLTLQQKTVLTPEGKFQTVYITNLEYWGSMEDLLEQAMHIQRRRIEYKLKTEMLEEQIREQLKKALPPFDESPEDIEEEFYPENWEENREEVKEEPEPHEKKEEETKQKEPAKSGQKESETMTLW